MFAMIRNSCNLKRIMQNIKLLFLSIATGKEISSIALLYACSMLRTRLLRMLFVFLNMT